MNTKRGANDMTKLELKNMNISNNQHRRCGVFGKTPGTAQERAADIPRGGLW